MPLHFADGHGFYPNIFYEEDFYFMTITKNILTRNDCYNSGRRITPIGMQLHTIGTAQDSAAALASYWNQPGIEACVHYCVDAASAGKVLQFLPDSYRSWADGGFGNNYLITVELMESDSMRYTSGANFTVTDEARFRADITRAYRTAVAFFAQKCMEYGWKPTDRLSNGLYVISSHNEGRLAGVSTAHVDPTHVWERLGFTMDQFRQDVSQEIARRKKPAKPSYTPWTGRVRTSSAALRKGAGKKKKLLKTLPRDTRLTVTGEKKSKAGNLWYRVKAGETAGYVYASRVRKE